jgi:soluble lytic murein transglycosylase-like protein
MRRNKLVIAAAVVISASALGAVWYAKRTVRWNDARTMPPPLTAAVRAYAKDDGSTGLASIRTLLRRYRAPAWEPRARVLAATRLAQAGREREIIEFLPKDLPPDNPLATHALLLRARGWLAREAFDRAAELAARAAAVPHFPGADEARLIRAQALAAGGNWRPALVVLDAAPSAAASIEAGRIAAKHGDNAGARRRVVDALLAATSEDDVDRLREAVEELVPDPGARFTAAERPKLADRARHWLDEGRATTASDLLHLVRPAGAPSAATPAEALVEAEALLKLGRATEMGACLARARQGDAATVDGARYLEARRSATLSNFTAYRVGLEAVARRSASPWRERAMLDLARAGEGAPSLRTLEAFRRYRLAAGGSADPAALLREGWAAYDLGRSAEADAGFARALAHPDAPNGVRVTAMYWRARIAERAGRAAEARASYTTIADTFGNHYYGALAARRLGRPLPVAPANAPGSPGTAAVTSSEPWLAAARAFVSVGLWDEAGPCYRAALRAAGASGAAIALEAAGHAREAAALSDAIGLAQDAADDRDRTPADQVPRELWRLLYPAAFAEPLTRAAKAAALDPNLVASVALQESAFNPLAVSAVGARGLLQIMPAIGAELSRAAGRPRFDPSDLFDPETNATLGSRHLSDYRRRFGSIPRALAAYNGGPSRVERWNVAAGPDDDERFVERIPIAETRLYVKRVLAGARMYSIAWPNGLGK